MKANTIKAINLITSLLLENEVIFNSGYNLHGKYFYFGFTNIDVETNVNTVKEIIETDVKNADCYNFAHIETKENKLGFSVLVKDK